MSGYTVVGVLMVAGLLLAIMGSLVGLLLVLLKGRGGRNGNWDAHPPRDHLTLRAGGGLGRGSSH
ncbi:hypothetical protein [Phycicoccus sp. SLBN-51]|uniref:hypothetical protein n=1 Tax=Phycicoccus sp. SLBN-51 TaxID=2768447 RepID=UPI00114E1622|nr:hypothetical protein [Phycicoccus sp. SLBN-51]TQJ52110.1 hypothetical protein FBY26_3854 [Phycicoccus sp. SLBN-51]